MLGSGPRDCNNNHKSLRRRPFENNPQQPHQRPAAKRPRHDVTQRQPQLTCVRMRTVVADDDHVMCPSHPGSQLQYFCSNCTDVICIVCLGSTCQGHVTVNINEHLRERTVFVREQQRLMRELIADSKKVTECLPQEESDALNSLFKVKEEARMTLCNLRWTGDEEYREIKREIERESNRVKQECARQSEIVKQKQTDLELCEEKCVSTLQSFKGLRLAIELEKLVPNIVATMKAPPRFPSLKPNPIFTRSHSKVLGSVCFLPEDDTSVRLGDVTTCKASFAFSRKIGAKPLSLAAVGDKLWVLQAKNMIVRFDVEGQCLNRCELPKQSPTRPGINQGREICNYQGDIVIAANNGLFLCQGEQNTPLDAIDWTLLLIAAGDYVSVTSYDTLLFALAYDGLVQVFVRPRGALTSLPNEVDSFKVAHYEPSIFNRIRASGTCIFLSLFYSGAVRRYSPDGKLVSTVHIPFPEVRA